MSLVLKSNDGEGSRDDYDVVHSELPVGRIWTGSVGHLDPRWFWTISGVFAGPDTNLCYAGVAATLADAKAQLETEWAKWLAWANLSEASESSQKTSKRNRASA